MKFVRHSVSQTQKNFQKTERLTIENHRKLQREKIHRWLFVSDFSTNYFRARRFRQKDTGLWFLQRAFNEWTNKVQFMWLHGKLDCGKTVLSSIIITQVDETCIFGEAAIVYFYFDFNDIEKQSSNKMIRSIVKQLYISSIKKNLKLESLFFFCNGERQLSFDELMQVLKDLMKGFHKSYIVFDVLNECSDVDELLAYIKQIQDWQFAELHMLFTSRRHTDIEIALKPLTDLKNRICIQNAAVNVDIETYTQHRLQTDKKSKRWQNHLFAQRKIKNAFKSKADGM